MSWAAVIIGKTVITWPAVLTALGAACTMLGTLGLHMARGRDPREPAAVFPAAVLFSLVAARLVHWFCHPLLYTGFREAMTNYLQGGFSLAGAFAGTALAVLLAWGAGLVTRPGDLLDAMAPAAALGIGVGRLGSLYDLSDRGKFLVEDPERQRLPFAALTEISPGVTEWRFATFFFQAMAAWALALALCAVFLVLTRRARRTGEGVSGRVFALFLALYGAAQAVLDSTRYDADFFRFNGFVHLPQVLCGAAVFGAAVWLGVRSIKKNGFGWKPCLCWLMTLGGLGLAGYMEYYVQRHADLAARGYALMTGGMALTALAAAVLCASLRDRKPFRPEAPAKPGGKGGSGSGGAGEENCSQFGKRIRFFPGETGN